jgi:transposase-like protein
VRAVDSEGETLDLLVQPRRDKAAAVKLMRKLLKKQGYAPAGRWCSEVEGGGLWR